MSDLTEFLLARIDEDEAEAREGQPEEGTVYGALGFFEPSRVLAECAAKRAIISGLDDALDTYAGMRAMDRVLEHMASVYKDHPDYREDW